MLTADGHAGPRASRIATVDLGRSVASQKARAGAAGLGRISEERISRVMPDRDTGYHLTAISSQFSPRGLTTSS